MKHIIYIKSDDDGVNNVANDKFIDSCLTLFASKAIKYILKN